MDIFSKRAPCGGWKQPRKIYLGGPNQHWVEAHRQVRVWKNTTQVPNPLCLEDCSPPDPCTPATVAPYARPSAEWCAAMNGEPGKESDLACCMAKAGPPSPVPANTYVESSPAEYVNRATCRKIGFKNVFAMKAWHGKFGPTALPQFGRITQTRGDGFCAVRSPSITAPARKYLAIGAAAEIEITGIAGDYGGGAGYGAGSAASTTSVGRLTGLMSGSCTASGTAGMGYTEAELKTQAMAAMSGFGGYTVDSAIDKFIARAGEVLTAYPSGTYSATLTGTPTITVDYYEYPDDPPAGNHVQVSLSCELSTGHYHYVQTIHGPREHAANGGYFNDDEEEITFTDSTCTYHRLTKQTQELNEIDVETTVTATYTSPYDSHYTDGSAPDVNTDTDALLDAWTAAVLDDSRYPWRVDADVTRGPLVTRNEVGARVPVILSVEGDYTETTTVPRTEMIAGATVGEPTPAGYEPYWDFRHEVWELYAMSGGLAGEQWRVKEYGQACPATYPCATQWLNNRQAQFIPAGPFAAYNSLRNPSTFSTGGCSVVEFAGYLVKCAWFEPIMFAVPSMNLARPCGAADRAAMKPANCAPPEGVVRWTGVPCHCDAPEVTTGCDSAPAPATEYVWNDATRKGEFVFKQWAFDFRDWAEIYLERQLAWYRSNVETESCSGATWTPTDVRRYREDATAWGLGTDPIQSGSLWLKTATVTEHCIEHQPCTPNVVYSSPVTVDFANAVQLSHPALVLDESYGSLWLGRVQQWLTDPLWMAPGPRSEDIAKLCDEDCAGGVLPDDGSGLADDLELLQCYYPYPPQVEARNTLPTGAPAFPADATPAFCGDVVAGLNTDPQVIFDASCYPPLSISRVFDPDGCGANAIYMVPSTYIPPWLTLLNMEACIAGAGRFSDVYGAYGL